MQQVLWLIALTAAFGLGNPVPAQDSGKNDKPASDTDNPKEKFIEQLRTHYHKHASAFVFAHNRDGAKSFLLEPRPVLTWTITGTLRRRSPATFRRGDTFLHIAMRRSSSQSVA